MRYQNRAAALFVAILLPLLFGVISCNKRTSGSEENSVAAANLHVGPPLTNEECTKFAVSLKEAIYSGDNAAANKLVDWDTLLETGMADVEATDSSRKNFAKGFKNFAGGSGFIGAIIESVKNDGSYDPLHVHSVEGEKRILFRWIQPNGGLRYHDWILARYQDGQTHGVDLYNFSSGERFTETARRGFLPVAVRESGLFKRPVVSDQLYVEHWPKLQQMNECLKAEKYQEGITAYRQLPERMRREKNILLLRLRLAQKAGDQEYSEAIQDFIANFPDDPCADLLAIDAYYLKKEFAKALQFVDHLDAAVGGDPYLNVLRSNLFVESGKLLEARKACQKAIEEEPTLKRAYWSLLNVSLQEKKFDETAELLSQLAEKLHEDIGDLTTTPGYAEFVHSPQYQKWMKSKKK